MTKDQLRKNLKKLISDGNKVLAATRPGNPALGEPEVNRYVDDKLIIPWRTNGLMLIRSMFGASSEHYAFATEFSRWTLANEAEKFQGILKAALTALDKDYFFSIQEVMRAEVESDLIAQARSLLAAQYYVAAAVVAGAVLEQHLRSTCLAHGISPHKPDGKPKTMAPINTDLYTNGIYDLIVHDNIKSLISIRNVAAHATAPMSAQDAERIVAEVPRLCDRVR